MTATLVLAAIQFPQGAQPGAVDFDVIRRLGLVYAPAILFFYMISIAFIAAYRISRETHEDNVRRLTGPAVGG
jgi:hypothetical protein